MPPRDPGPPADDLTSLLATLGIVLACCGVVLVSALAAYTAVGMLQD